MDFAELQEITRQFVGKMVDVAISIPVEGIEDGRSVGHFSGTVDRVQVGGEGASWNLWFEDDRPGPVVATFHPSLFIDAEFTADREKADQMPVGERGMTWTLVVEQAGAVTDTMVYV